MKKPIIVDNIVPPSLVATAIEEIKGPRHNVYLGEVSGEHSLCMKEDLLHTLEGRLQSYGLKPVARGGYRPAEVIRINGAVGAHRDLGLGLVLNWFIGFCEPYPTYLGEDDSPWLATPWGLLSIKVGDVFLFNADELHSWVHNGSCFLAQMTVSKPRTNNRSHVKMEA